MEYYGKNLEGFYSLLFELKKKKKGKVEEKLNMSKEDLKFSQND